MHLIDVRDVYKIYNPGENQVNALDGVSLTIDEGEFVAIIGQSGSGKSTLMNMLGLLDVPTSGEYYINGNLVEDLTDDQMSVIRNEQIGFIFQGFNLISSLTAVENVELPLVYRGMGRQERREIAEKALARVGLDKRMYHLPAEMSGGQQQRVAVARAIAAAPPVILADEPTGNLDTKSTKEVMAILHRLKDEGRTVVVITHQMSVVEEICDSVAILDGGVVVEQGEVREIFANPKTAAARRLVAPNGGSAARDLSSFAPDDHVVRVTFNGSSAAKPLVASLAAEKGILVSVLSADTRDLSGQCYGSMLLKLPRDTEQAKQAAAYMRSQNGVTVEEVTGE